VAIEHARILIVDDEAPNVRLMEEILSRSGYRQARGITDSRRVLELFSEFHPDLVLLDLHMPHLDGFAVMELLRSRIPPDTFLPILVLTGDISSAVRKRALSSGATDFVNKPLDAGEVLLRIRNLLETRLLHLELQGQKQVLEDKVRGRTAELEHSRLETLERLARAAEYRDYDTGLHAQRVGDVAAMVAEQLGIGADEVELVRQAAPLHDIGKIGISDTILLKPGRLSPAEYEVMRRTPPSAPAC
jgi:putative two-component system response regulator